MSKDAPEKGCVFYYFAKALNQAAIFMRLTSD